MGLYWLFNFNLSIFIASFEAMQLVSLSAIILLGLIAISAHAKGDVSISLSARWEGTPYIAEVAEALVRELFFVISSDRPLLH